MQIRVSGKTLPELIALCSNPQAQHSSISFLYTNIQRDNKIAKKQEQ